MHSSSIEHGRKIAAGLAAVSLFGTCYCKVKALQSRLRFSDEGRSKSTPRRKRLLDHTKNEPIRVLIVDRDLLVGRALARLLQDSHDVEVVAIAADGWAAIRQSMLLQPVVALVDAQTARLDGLAFTRNMHQQAPTIRIVIVSVYAWFRSQALAAGACRFLLKDCGRDELVRAIRLAALGHCQKSSERWPNL